MASSVLFVCQANVCRSPLMAYAFEAALTSKLATKVRVSSAGTDANKAEICSLVAELISTQPDGVEFATKHRAVHTSKKLLERHGLIIAASRAQRAALAQLDPSTRSRTFTLREALVLVEGLDVLPSPGEQDLASEFAAALSARRGLVIPSRSPRGFFRPAGNPLDVPDVHQYTEKRHRRALPEIRDEAAALGAAFRRFADLSS